MYLSTLKEKQGSTLFFPFGFPRRRVKNLDYFEYSLHKGSNFPSFMDSLELVRSILDQSIYSHLFYVLNSHVFNVKKDANILTEVIYKTL